MACDISKLIFVLISCLCERTTVVKTVKSLPDAFRGFLLLDHSHF